MTDESELQRLRESNKQLIEQLEFMRQKASLYYITSSELDSLRQATHGSVVTIDKGTSTETVATSVPSTSSTCSQTVNSSESTAFQNEIEMLRAEVEILKTMNTLNEKTERKRIECLKILSRVDGTSTSLVSILSEYSQLFREYLKSNQVSINHSIEIRKRDNMIESLLEKIKLLESSFSRKLATTEHIASSREQVIRELGEQVREVMANGEISVDWMTLAAMHAEIEDLKAELSKARTNWAATRDELMRVQAGIGRIDEDGSSIGFSRITYGSPKSDEIITTLSRLRDLRRT